VHLPVRALSPLPLGVDGEGEPFQLPEVETISEKRGVPIAQSTIDRCDLSIGSAGGDRRARTSRCQPPRVLAATWSHKCWSIEHGPSVPAPRRRKLNENPRFGMIDGERSRDPWRGYHALCPKASSKSSAGDFET
jgi:hypothetical protein